MTLDELNAILETGVTVAHLVGIYIGLLIGRGLLAILDAWWK